MEALTSIIRILLLAALCIAVVAFVMANPVETLISFHPLPFEYTYPLYTIIGSAFVTGLLFAGLVLYGNRSSRIRMLRKENKRLERELKHERGALKLAAKTAGIQEIKKAQTPPTLTLAS